MMIMMMMMMMMMHVDLHVPFYLFQITQRMQVSSNGRLMYEYLT